MAVMSFICDHVGFGVYRKLDHTPRDRKAHLMSEGDRTSDTALIRAADIWLALGLLTRLPLPWSGDQNRAARAAWAWPLAGAVLGLLGALTGGIAMAFDLPTGVCAALTLTALIIASGALHEDGLADTADGFWGGWTPERRLEIMRDSRIGTYGVLALGLSLLARWSLIAAALDHGSAGPVLIASAAISRAPMVALMAHLAPARADGLARAVGRPATDTAWLACGVASGVALIFAGFGGFLALLMGFAVAIGLGALAKTKIGGQTGDVLGASQQLAEIAAMAVLVAALT